jgi:hypothetical protein
MQPVLGKRDERRLKCKSSMFQLSKSPLAEKQDIEAKLLSPKPMSPAETTQKAYNKNMFRSQTKNEFAKSPGFLSRNTGRAGDTLEEVKKLINN